MGFRKFKGSRLFTGTEFAPEDAVLITDDKGKVEAIISLPDAGEEITYLEGIISPGFINCHCHIELSHMKGQLPPGSGMVPFLLGVMQQREQTADEIHAAMEKAENEMLVEGIVAVGDICNTAASLSLKENRRLYYHNFIEVAGFTATGAPGRFAFAVEIFKRFTSIGPATIVPHAPYSVSPELFRLIGEASSGKLVSMHNQESVDENEFFRSGNSAMRELYKTIGVDIGSFVPPGISSIAAVLPYLERAASILLVHNVVTSAEDIQFINRHHQQVYYCLCPNANRYINEQLPPVDMLMQQQCHVVLGTDSLASNQRLSILEEMRSLHIAFPSIPLERLFYWATASGAAALGIADRFGSFEKGKSPGVIEVHQWQSRRLI